MTKQAKRNNQTTPTQTASAKAKPAPTLETLATIENHLQRLQKTLQRYSDTLQAIEKGEKQPRNPERAKQALEKMIKATKKRIESKKAERVFVWRILGIINDETIDGIAKAFSIQAIKTAMQSGGNPETAETAEKAQTGGNFNFMYSLYVGAVRDNTQAEKDYKTPFSDAKDIAQTACVFLCNYRGKLLTDNAENGKTDKNGNPVSVGRACFQAMNAYINGERQKEYKRAYLDDENGAFYEIPLFWDMPTITDYKAVCRVIEKLKLSQMEKRILRYRMQGKSLAEIAFAVSLAEGTIKTYCNRIKTKCKKVYGVDETTAETAQKARANETAKRKAETAKRNETPTTTKTADFESKTTAEKVATLKRLYKKAKANGETAKAEKIRRFALKLIKAETAKAETAEKQKEIEKRLARLVKQANAPQTAKA